MIEVRGITKSYGNDHNRYMVLDNVSFTVPDGASVAIIGKSGSGKSSLLQAMGGLARPDMGQIIIDGQDILSLSDREVEKFRASYMGFIFQSFFIQSSQTCAKNVSLPTEILGLPRKQRDAMITQTLEAVGLAEKKMIRARNLSGGQKQRLAIARAIVNRPKVLFADEPTGNLDSVTGKAIADLLFWCNKTSNMTLVIVTHDNELAKKCDMQITVSDGRVVSIKQNGESVPTHQLAVSKDNFAQLAGQKKEGEQAS